MSGEGWRKRGRKKDRKKKGWPGRERRRCVGVSPLFRLVWMHKSSPLNIGTKSKLDPVRRGGGFYVVENVALEEKKEGEVVVLVVKE